MVFSFDLLIVIKELYRTHWVRINQMAPIGCYIFYKINKE